MVQNAFEMNAWSLPELEINLFSLCNCRDKYYPFHSGIDIYFIFTENKQACMFTYVHFPSSTAQLMSNDSPTIHTRI